MPKIQDLLDIIAKMTNSPSETACFEGEFLSINEQNIRHKRAISELKTLNEAVHNCIDSLCKIEKCTDETMQYPVIDTEASALFKRSYSSANGLLHVIRELSTDSDSPRTDERKKEYIEWLSYKVSSPENAVFRITLPPLVPIRLHGCYNVYHDVKMVLEDYFSRHKKPVFRNEKLLLIYKKYAPRLTIDYTCDNDNWEMKRVTNAIAESLNCSDSAGCMSFLYTAVLNDNSFAEVTLIRQADLGLFLDYINEKNPQKPA